MKVVLVQGECPSPAAHGPHNHSLAVIRMLLGMRVDLTILACCAGDSDRKRWDQFESDYDQCRLVRVQRLSASKRLVAVVRALSKGFLPVVAKCPVRAIVNAVQNDRSLQENDLIIVDRYLVMEAARAWPNRKKLFLPHDFYSLAAERGLKWASGISEKLFWCRRLWGYRNMERYASKLFDTIAPVSPVDLSHWKDRHPSCNYDCVPIAVAPDFLEVAYAPPVNGIHLLIHGLFQFESKCVQVIDFFKHIYPNLKANHPNLTVSIWAPELHSSLAALLRSLPEVEILGWVDDYKATLLSASVYYYPMAHCSGVQTKLLEAMALGLPVVASFETLSALAVDGYDLHQQPAYSVSNLDEAFEALDYLLTSEAARCSLSSKARNYVKGRYTADEVAKRLERVIFRR